MNEWIGTSHRPLPLVLPPRRFVHWPERRMPVDVTRRSVRRSNWFGADFGRRHFGGSGKVQSVPRSVRYGSISHFDFMCEKRAARWQRSGAVLLLVSGPCDVLAVIGEIVIGRVIGVRRSIRSRFRPEESVMRIDSGTGHFLIGSGG